MSLTVETIFTSMMDAGASSFGENWGEIAIYGETEFKKMAQQIADIANNVAAHDKDPTQGYDVNAAKILLKMQRLATANVLVAMSAMAMEAVEQAIDAMLGAVKHALGGVLSAIL